MKKAALTIKEAAEYLGCSVWSVYELVYQKKIKHFRIGRRILIQIAVLDEFMNQGGTDNGGAFSRGEEDAGVIAQRSARAT